MRSKILLLCLLTFVISCTEQKVDRVIVFGDSLSDTGTYSNFAGPLGGGKFTTNPGKIWVEIIADKMNLNLEVNRKEGFGLKEEIVGGFNYAQGGARIKNPNGNGKDKGYSTRPLSEQVDLFLNENSRFSESDLVFLLGGANDIFMLTEEVANGKITPNEAVQLARQTALDLVEILKNVKQMGAKKIIVFNLPQIEKTPKVITLPPNVIQLVALMGASFNNELASQIDEGTILVDLYNFDKEFNDNFEFYGFKNITNPACDFAKLPFKSSLVCNESTLVEANAQDFYKFADNIHPTEGYSRVIAEFIWAKIKGLL